VLKSNLDGIKVPLAELGCFKDEGISPEQYYVQDVLSEAVEHERELVLVPL